jgi:hypothetical protein
VSLNSSLAVVVLACCASLSGCGKSREDVAVDRLANLPKPAHVRFLNLSPEAVSMYDRNNVMVGPIGSDSGSQFAGFGSGAKTIHLKGESVDVSVPTDFKPDESALIILRSDGKHAAIASDERVLANGANVKLAYVDEAGSVEAEGPPVNLSKGPETKTLSGDASTGTLTPGIWKVTAKGLANAASLTVGADRGYKLILVKRRDGRYLGVILERTTREVPRVAGQASS